MGYILPIPEGNPRRFTIGWLLLSIASLVIAGMYSIILVLSRTPYIQAIFPFVDFFHAALVVHVDLSILIWFLSFSGVFYSLIVTHRFAGLDRLALGLACIGTAVIAVSPFVEQGIPLMNNYIPILDNHAFLYGLLIFAVGFALLHIRTLFDFSILKKTFDGERIIKYGIFTGAVIGFAAVMSFLWSYLAIPETVKGAAFYEYLFWGGGHVIQFVHTQLMLVSWLWLAGVSGVSFKATPSTLIIILSLSLVSVVITPVIYISHDVVSAEHINAFTNLMKYGMGMPVIFIGILVCSGIIMQKGHSDMLHIRASITTSMMLFASGGAIGFLIQGINVTIPAHYHGVIVGVTLSYMGVTYYLLPELGFGSPSQRLARIQLYTYGAGQLLHIIGLAWAGGYGIKRKTAGTAQGLESLKEIASMGLMGMGGLIAVIGGLLFLLIVIRAMRRAND